jgi:hypothetical protein
MAAYKQAADLTSKQYAHQQDIFGPMAEKFKAIFDLGPSQKGFSDAESNTLNAQAIEGTATNYKAAAQAVNEGIAAEGGGGYMPSGAAESMRLRTAESAAQEESREQTAITEADYSTGRQQWQQAGAGLLTIAGGENPLGYQTGATNAGGAASTTANDIAAAQNSWVNAAIGAAGTALGGWAGHH